MTFARMLLLALLSTLSLASASAACVIPSFALFPEKNGNVVVSGAVTKGTPCVHKLGVGPGYRFTSVTSVRDPEHGSLSITGAATLTYRPQKRFDGKDFYGVRACATKGSLRGCSTIYFVLATQ